MSTAERTILVATIAGGFAIATYLFQHYRSGDLDWRRHLWPSLAMAGGLAAFVTLLLLTPTWLPRIAIPALALGAGIYLLRRSGTRANAVAGWAFVIAGAAGVASLVLLALVSET
jgi:hypothetical protein